MSHRPSLGAERGFTLIEVMIVVAIIAILAAILIPNVVNARAQAQTSACESNLRAIATAAELYYADNNSYPQQAGNVQDILGSASGGTSTTVYLKNIPRDPAAASDASYAYAPVDSGQGYTITCPGSHTPSTLSKLSIHGASASGGSACGAGCAATTIYYDSGTGLSVGSGTR